MLEKVTQQVVLCLELCIGFTKGQIYGFLLFVSLVKDGSPLCPTIPIVLSLSKDREGAGKLWLSTPTKAKVI